MNIVVLDGYTLNPGDNPWDDVAALGDLAVHDRTPDHLIVERARAAQIVLVNKTLLSAATLAALPDLRLVCVLATGYNVVDVRAARRRGVPVANVPAYATDSVAQFVFALLLELCHRVARHDTAVRQGAWAASGDFSFWNCPLVELAGQTLGIVGFGHIGRRVGAIAHALGMRVLATDVAQGAAPDYPVAWKSVPELFAESDVVSLHCPQTAANTGLVDAALLRRMKPTAFFINTARGRLVVEADLAAALADGALAGAACDVVSAEPIREDNPLLQAPNLVLTPHMAWATVAARRRLMQATAENIRAFLAGRPVNIVN